LLRHRQRRLHLRPASDLELGETTKMTFDEVKQAGPSRVVFDSLSEIRLLAQNPLRHRRQVIALKAFFCSATVHWPFSRWPH